MPLIEFTRRGYIEVYDSDGNKVSQHTLEREAIERVSNLILEQPAGKESKFEIRGPLIVAKGYGVLSPGTPGGDTSAPTTPGSLAGLATSATTITLSWTQSTDNIGVAGYQVFRNGSPIATTSNLSYNDSGLTPSTQYSYTVTAYDAAGNNSSAAGPALVTTNSNSAPVWSLGNQSYDNGDAVNISLDGVCSDADGDTITYSLVSGSLPTGLTLSGARNQTLSGTVTADGAYAFTLGASDGIASVQNVAVTFTVSTPDTTAPDAPSAPTVSAYTSSTITLTLPTSAAGDHASYTIQRSTDGVSYGNRATGITASSWQDTGLSSSTTYYYRLIDVDTSNNASTPGAAVSRQTSAPTAGTNAARIDAVLAGRSPHFSYSTPADPVTTQQITVTSASQFNQYAGSTPPTGTAGGWRITINSSFSGDVTIAANDIDVVMSNSATITGNLYLGQVASRSNRVRWTGGNLSGRLLGIHFADYLFDDFNVNMGTQYGDLTAGWTGSSNLAVNRLAFINCTLRNSGWNGANGNNWVIFLAQSPRHSDIFFGNTLVHGDGIHILRLQAVDRLSIVGCALVHNSSAAGSSLRVHAATNGLWIKDTWGNGAFHCNHINDSDNGPGFYNGLLDNFDRYAESANLGAYAYSSKPTGVWINNTGTVQNSTLYNSGGSGTITFPDLVNGGGNTNATWNQTTLPDYSTVGAIR